MQLSEKHKEFEQIAVDIFHRQGKLQNVAEHRLAQGRPVDALRCLKDPQLDQNWCLKILKAAWATNSRQTKYTVYTTLKDVRRLSCFDSPSNLIIYIFNTFCFRRTTRQIQPRI